MKKSALFMLSLLLFAFTLRPATLTDKERKDASDILSKTEQAVFDAVKGLSEAQLKFKAAPDRWSVEECVKHIAMTEQALWQMTAGAMKETATAEKKAAVKMTDDQVISTMEDRSHKVKTAPPLEPQNTPFKSLSEALESFKTNREKLIEYVKTTNDDMRSHVTTMPFASFDCYQMVLFIAAHSNRHTQQIDEVKGDPGFPKK